MQETEKTGTYFESLEVSLSTAAGDVTRAVQRRDEQIRRAFEHGMPAIQIGEAVGMTRQGVYKIVKGGGSVAS